MRSIFLKRIIHIVGLYTQVGGGGNWKNWKKCHFPIGKKNFVGKIGKSAIFQLENFFLLEKLEKEKLSWLQQMKVVAVQHCDAGSSSTTYHSFTSP